MGEAIIKLDQVVKNYGSHQVLKNVDMQVNKGDIYGIVGKNATGKATIFKMILGPSERDSGTISIAGSKTEKELYQYRG